MVGFKAKGRGGLKPKKNNKRGMFPSFKKKFCRLCVEKATAVDYKDSKKLEAFIKERGKMVSSRISGNCAKHQRLVSEAIKNARFLALLPYTKY